jgi:hypothetical protein
MIKEEIDRRKFLSISFKSVVSASATIMATKVSAYEQYLGEDSTNVDINSRQNKGLKGYFFTGKPIAH